MRFGTVPLEEATGAILAHTLHPSGTTLKKGTVLGPTEMAALRQARVTTVVVATLEPGDVPEDEAAAVLGRAASGPGVRAAAPATGRCNLYATVRGVVVVDAARVDAVNAVDEALTIATLPPFSVVSPDEMVATVKVIPFATSEDLVAACRAQAADPPILAVAPLRPHRAGLVLTRLDGGDEHLLDKASGVLRARLEALGSTLHREVRCDHDPVSVAAAIAAMTDCAPILVLGASAVVDRHDVVPAAVVAAGGAIDHLGMPVDPGNLLLLAHLGETAVIGVPGCARSPAPSGFDRVLERLLAGIAVTGRDVMGMGAGGLLKEIPTRPQPRRKERARKARIAAIVLAAGRSSRMGQNKLLLPIGGTPMVRAVVEALRPSTAVEIVVVTGHDADAVDAVLAGSGARIVHNPDFALGLSTSLKAGLDAVGDVDGVVVALGDMPCVRAAHVDALIASFDPVEGRAIGVPVHEGKRGNPVLWAARYFPQMRALSGDEGARSLILAYADAIYTVPVDDPGVLLDVDTPEALARLEPSGG